jgi:hypothetical protein
MRTKEENTARHHAAMHAMQTGVAATMRRDPHETNPKHLRVGINAAMSDQRGLATLLIAKGIFTEEEYFEAIADSAEQEKQMYERELGVKLG